MKSTPDAWIVVGYYPYLTVLDDPDRYLTSMITYTHPSLQGTLGYLFCCISLGGTV